MTINCANEYAVTAPYARLESKNLSVFVIARSFDSEGRALRLRLEEKESASWRRLTCPNTIGWCGTRQSAL